MPYLCCNLRKPESSIAGIRGRVMATSHNTSHTDVLLSLYSIGHDHTHAVVNSSRLRLRFGLRLVWVDIGLRSPPRSRPLLPPIGLRSIGGTRKTSRHRRRCSKTGRHRHNWSCGYNLCRAPRVYGMNNIAASRFRLLHPVLFACSRL